VLRHVQVFFVVVVAVVVVVVNVVVVVKTTQVEMLSSRQCLMMADAREGALAVESGGYSVD